MSQLEQEPQNIKVEADQSVKEDGQQIEVSDDMQDDFEVKDADLFYKPSDNPDSPRVAEAIKDVKNFTELFAALDKLGEIHGKVEVYTPEKLKSLIVMFIHHQVPGHAIIRTGGLRKKVIDLLLLSEKGK